MLTPDVRFEGWTTETWRRYLHLWKPRAAPDLEPTRPRGGVIAVHDGERLRKLLHTRTGRLEPSIAWPVPLSELAATYQASWAFGVRVGALEEVMERFGERVRRTDDLTAQSLRLVGIVQEMMGEGVIEAWPRRLRGVPTPTEPMVRRALDAVCAPGKAILLGLFKEGELWTAFVARRRAKGTPSGGGIDVIAGPEELREEMGLLSGDWRRDYRHLARVVEDRYAPLAFGCFAEVDLFRALQMDARPGAWGRAVAVRDVILSPWPAAIGLAIGLDGARYALEHMRILTSRLDRFGLLEPALRGVRARLGSAAGDKDVGTVLGFDPMAALRALLKR